MVLCFFVDNVFCAEMLVSVHIYLLRWGPLPLIICGLRYCAVVLFSLPHDYSLLHGQSMFRCKCMVLNKYVYSWTHSIQSTNSLLSPHLADNVVSSIFTARLPAMLPNPFCTSRWYVLRMTSTTSDEMQ
jgi:hypothetical protein